jgi:hypothetical protein
MTETLDQDVDALRELISGAWRQLADPSATVLDRREVRNSMKEAEIALRAVLKRIADSERARGDAHALVWNVRNLDFRILRLEA